MPKYHTVPWRIAHDLAIIERKLGPLNKRVKDHLVVIEVSYYSFADSACTLLDTEHLWSGVLMVHACVAEDVQAMFAGFRADTFPIARVIPINRYGLNHDSTGWNDAASMEDNNTSAFNYRRKPTSAQPSEHAKGTALDINPMLNPFMRTPPKARMVRPEKGRYDPRRPGTLNQGIIRKHLHRRGWAWGGRWPNPKDYQHIEYLGAPCTPPIPKRP
jgi:peptidoglycan LD-endopeptidase CwlK